MIMNGNVIWLGVVPLVLFAILDSRTSKKGAVISAFVTAIIEVVFSVFYSKGGIDFITILTILILSGSVFLSLLKDDTFYFKISGSISWILFSVIMLFSVFVLGEPLLTAMMDKYIGFEVIAKQYPNVNIEMFKILLDKLSVTLPIFITLHSAIAILAAKKWNKWVWLFIRLTNPYFEMFLLTIYYGMMIA